MAGGISMEHGLDTKRMGENIAQTSIKIDP